MSRVIFIGDVHGCLDELKELVAKTNFNPSSDRIIMVGDLVDRGPDSAGCVRFVRTSGFDCVAGNHDNKFARFYRHEQKKKSSLQKKERKPYKNPMRFNEEKRITYEALSEADLQWLADLPDSIHLKEQNLLVVHAGVQPGRYPFEQAGNVYRHCRYVDNKSFKLMTLNTTTFAKPEGSSLWDELYDGTVNIVHGHHVGDLEKPQVRYNSSGAWVAGIDTGCCFGGKLTAFWVDKESGCHNFVQVTAKKTYCSK